MWHCIYWRLSIIILLVYIIVYCLYLLLFTLYPLPLWGTRWRSWLRHCAISQKVAGLIPDGVRSLNILEPSGPVQACNGIAVPFTVYLFTATLQAFEPSLLFFLTSVHDPESLASILCISFYCMDYSAIWEMLAADWSTSIIVMYLLKSHLTHHHENLTSHNSVNINYREAIQEDEEGLLEGSVAEIIQRAKRKRQSERRGNTRLGMMRHLYLVVDNSDCMSNQDLKPTRQLCTVKVIS